MPEGKTLATTVSAVAVDDLGARTASEPVSVFVVSPFQVHLLVELLSPHPDDMFVAPATFEYGVQFLTRDRPLDAPPFPGPVEFYIGTNFVGSRAESPFSITVTNLSEGEYKLRVRVLELFSDDPQPITIHVTKMGIRSVRRTAEGQITFGAFNVLGPDQTIVEASSNLADWLPRLTNAPSLPSFHFFDDMAERSYRFYRLLSRPP